MSRHNKGKRVLVEGTDSGPFFGVGPYPSRDIRFDDCCGSHSITAEHIHPHPGVSVEALLEEIDLLWELVLVSGQWDVAKANRVGQLQVAREAAQKPKRTAVEDVLRGAGFTRGYELTDDEARHLLKLVAEHFKYTPANEEICTG